MWQDWQTYMHTHTYAHTVRCTRSLVCLFRRSFHFFSLSSLSFFSPFFFVSVFALHKTVYSFCLLLRVSLSYGHRSPKCISGGGTYKRGKWEKRKPSLRFARPGRYVAMAGKANRVHLLNRSRILSLSLSPSRPFVFFPCLSCSFTAALLHTHTRTIVPPSS